MNTKRLFQVNFGVSYPEQVDPQHEDPIPADHSYGVDSITVAGNDFESVTVFAKKYITDNAAEYAPGTLFIEGIEFQGEIQLSDPIIAD